MEFDSIKEVEPKSTEDSKASASEALMDDLLGGGDLDGSRRHHHGYPYQQFPLHINRPTSTINALQYTVRDGNITVKSR